MNDEYIEVPKTSGTYVRRSFPRELEELIASHKSNWVANSRGGEPNHWEERK